MSAFEPQIEELTLVPAKGGIFEVTVDDHLVYSKMRTGRHADPGEVHDLVRKYLLERLNKEE